MLKDICCHYIVRNILRLRKVADILKISIFGLNIPLVRELSVGRTDERLYVRKPVSNGISIDLTLVSFNSAKWIEGLFLSLIKQSYPLGKINLYIVDNSSTDNSLELLEKYVTEFKTLFNEIIISKQPNLGYGSGHDTAIKLGKSKYIFIINMDAILEPDSLYKIIQEAENSDDIVASWEMMQKPFEHPKYYDPVTLETPWCSYAATLIRREAYERVGGFEKRIFMYGEDVELSYRFRSYGYKLKYYPSALVWHYSYEAGMIKPLQYTKSVLANSFIRLRYGSFLDIIAIPFIYLALLIRTEKFPGSKMALLKNCLEIFKNAGYFLTSRRRTNKIVFPFRLIDYSPIREGSAIELKYAGFKPLISVIMRTTARRSFDQIKHSIKTIANQIYTNIEFIMVEDGSSVHQLDCQKLCSQLKLKFQYHPLPKVGRSKAGNHGMIASTGEYLMFLDDDDYLFADHIDTLVSNIPDVNSRYDAVYSLSWEAIVDKDSLLFNCKSLCVPPNLNQPFNFNILRVRNFIPIQAIIFNKQLFIDRGGFDLSLEYLEDWNLWYRYCYKSRVKFVPKVTSIYTITDNMKEFLQRNKKFKAAYYAAKDSAKRAIESIDQI